MAVDRRDWSVVRRVVLSVAFVAPVATMLAAAGGPAAPSLGGAAASCCARLVADASFGPAAVSSSTALTGVGIVRAQRSSATAWRVVPPAPMQPAVLPVGVAKEAGLQVKTILAARAVSGLFPEIRDIGGVRPDALRWHPDGLAIDVMIPDWHSAAGVALGNRIVAFVLANSDRFGLDHVIWRNTLYLPDGTQRGGMGHYDHVHIATDGGGYPTGQEVYLR